MRFLAYAGGTLLSAGIGALIADIFFDVFAQLAAVGGICAFALFVYMLIDDVEGAIAGGLLGGFLFILTLLVSPIVAIILGALFIGLSEADLPFT